MEPNTTQTPANGDLNSDLLTNFLTRFLSIRAPTASEEASNMSETTPESLSEPPLPLLKKEMRSLSTPPPSDGTQTTPLSDDSSATNTTPELIYSTPSHVISLSCRREFFDFQRLLTKEYIGLKHWNQACLVQFNEQLRSMTNRQKKFLVNFAYYDYTAKMVTTPLISAIRAMFDEPNYYLAHFMREVAELLLRKGADSSMCVCRTVEAYSSRDCVLFNGLTLKRIRRQCYNNHSTPLSALLMRYHRSDDSSSKYNVRIKSLLYCMLSRCALNDCLVKIYLCIKPIKENIDTIDGNDVNTVDKSIIDETHQSLMWNCRHCSHRNVYNDNSCVQCKTIRKRKYRYMNSTESRIYKNRLLSKARRQSHKMSFCKDQISVKLNWRNLSINAVKQLIRAVGIELFGFRLRDETELKQTTAKGSFICALQRSCGHRLNILDLVDLVDIYPILVIYSECELELMSTLCDTEFVRTMRGSHTILPFIVSYVIGDDMRGFAIDVFNDDIRRDFCQSIFEPDNIGSTYETHSFVSYWLHRYVYNDLKFLSFLSSDGNQFILCSLFWYTLTKERSSFNAMRVLSFITDFAEWSAYNRDYWTLQCHKCVQNRPQLLYSLLKKNSLCRTDRYLSFSDTVAAKFPILWHRASILITADRHCDSHSYIDTKSRNGIDNNGCDWMYDYLETIDDSYNNNDYYSRWGQ